MIRFADASATDTNGIRYVSPTYGLPTMGGLRGDSYTTTIASGTAISTTGTVISIPTGYRIATIRVPAEWTSANINFQGSEDGVTFEDSYDQYGTKIVITPVAGARSTVEPITGLLIATPRYLKVVSTVNQTSTVVVTLVTVSI